MPDFNEHTSRTPAATAHTFTSPVDMRKKLIIGVVIIVLALLAFGFIATRSLPGDMLYDVKIRVIENLNESVQTTKQGKAAYQSERMRERLEELKTLSERGSISDAARDDVRAMTTLHTQTLKSAVALTEDEVPSPDVLRAISDFTDVAAAMETLSERKESLQELGEHMEDVRREVVTMYHDQVERYAERETPENIYGLVKTLLTEVSNEINNTDISDDTIDDAEVYINRVGPAMAEGDYPRAISAIAEAKRFIMIEKYGALAGEKTVPQETKQATTTEATTATTSETDTTPAQ